MEQVVFSVKDGGLVIEDSIIELYENSYMIASTLPNVSDNEDIYLLPSTLIRKQTTDEELAEEKYNDYEFSQIKIRGIFHEDRLRELDKSTFLAGRKSFVDKPIIDFSTWYSGMDREKVVKAYERYLLETPLSTLTQ